MQAPHPQASRIAVNFGEKHGAGTPLDLQLVFDLFSPELSQVRKALGQTYNIQVPETCIAFELIVAQGTAKQKAESLAQIQKKLSIFEQIPNSFRTFYNGNRVLGLIEAPEFAQLLRNYEQYFANLKPQAQNESHPISMRVFSNNDLGVVGSNLEKEGFLAWMQSLHYEFNFVKNEFVTKTLITLFEEILEEHRFSSMIKAFKKLNLEVNFTSSNFLRQFEKIRTGEMPTLPRSDLTLFLEEANIQSGRLFVLNPTLFIKGDFVATGLATLLKIVLK